MSIPPVTLTSFAAPVQAVRPVTRKSKDKIGEDETPQQRQQQGREQERRPRRAEAEDPLRGSPAGRSSLAVQDVLLTLRRD